MVRPTQEGRVLPLTTTQSTPGTDAGGEDLDWDSSSSTAAIIVEESDGYPSVAGVSTLIFDSAGFLVTDNADGSVLIENLGASAVDTSLVTVAATGATETIDVSVARTYDLTLDTDCTLSLSGAVNDEAWYVTVILRQDGTGGWDVTWPGSVAWPGGVTPTLDGTAGSSSVYTLFTLDGGTNWFGFPTGNETIADILDLPTAETDTSLVLAPDGAGGVEFRAETGGATALADLTDVNLDYLADGDILIWDEASGFWIASAPPSGSVPDGTDPGDILAWDGAAWAVLPVGTDGQMIYADSGETLGLLWDDAPAGGGELAFGSNTYTGANKTTTSGSFADVDSTNCSVTITTGARRCKVTAEFTAYNTSAGNSVCFDFDIDGSRQGDTDGLALTNNGQPTPFTLVYITNVLTAASHTFKLQWMRVSAGTGTIITGSGLLKIRMWVEELNLTT